MGLASSMKPTDSIRFYAATDVGRVRDHNEDNFLVDKKLALFIVCDGMGGHAAGEVASAIAVRTVHEELKGARETLAGYVGGGAVSLDSAETPTVTPREVIALLEHAVQSA